MQQDVSNLNVDDGKTAVSNDTIYGNKVSGDMVAGDQYTLDIKDSEAVAIGAGARAEINHYTEIIVKLDTIEDLPPAPGEPPYKGLAYFTEKDADIYYGRESLSQHIAARLSQQHFLALIGASGSGKSSLLRAGVIPRLRDQNWLIHVITPGAHPLSALTNSLARDVNSLDFAPKLEKMMRQKTDTLHLIGSKFASRADAPRLLLAVDQFEEVFTQCDDENERRAFVENLLTAANKKGSVTILIGLRADFYDRCAHFEGLRELVSQKQEFIGPMNQQELVRIIAEPAKRGGWQFAEGMVEQILEDAGQEPGRLPLLSHALRETWERRRGVAMTLAGYRAAGGVEGAIAKTAEEVLGRFDEGETAVSKSIFLSLTELGEGAEDTRRIAELAELEAANAGKPLNDVLQTLSNARLITIGDGQVEVAHEALIRRWPRLRDWLADNRTRLRFERQLAHDAKQWELLGKDSGALYRGARLQQAVEWYAGDEIRLVGRSSRFLAASREESERAEREKEAQRQRELAQAKKLAEEQKQRAEAEKKRSTLFRRALIGGSALMLFLLVAIVAAVVQTDRASTNSRESTARELAASAISNLNVDPERSILLALYAAKATHDVDETVVDEALEALHQALQKSHIRQTLEGHTELVSAVAFNADGTRTATTSGDDTLKIWNTLTGDEVMSLDHTGDTLAVAFSPIQGSTIIATGSIDDVATVWDISTNQKIFTLDTHDGSVWDVAFNADGTRLATASGDTTVKIWDVSTGKEVQSFSGHEGVVKGIDFSPDGTMIASAGEDKTVRLWDVSTGSAIYTFTEHADTVDAVAFNPDGTFIATTSHDGKVKTWDLVTHEEIRSFLGHTGEVYDVAFNDDGTKLVTVSADETAIVWNVASGNGILALRGHTDKVWGVAFSPDGEMVATASKDKTAKIWNVSVDGEKIAVNGHDGTITSAEFSPDGKHVITAGQDGVMNVWDIASGQPLFNHSVPDAQTWGVAYHPNGTQMVTTSTDGTVTVRDAGSGQELFQFLEQQGGVLRVAYAADGTKIATTGIDGTVKIWDSVTGSEGQTLVGHIDDDGNGIPVQDVAFSPNGELVASAGNDGKVVLWELASGQQRHVFEPEQGGIAIRVIFTPDGTRLAASLSDRDDSAEIVKVWDVESYEELFTLSGHRGGIQGVAISQDGVWIATASKDGMVKLWDADAGLELFTISDRTAENWDVNFNADGTQLLVARSDGTAVIYILNHDSLFALAGSRLTRSLTDEECSRFLHIDKCE